MANIAFPNNTKTLTLSTSHIYSYISIPSPTLPTILFLHGFSSSSYDWRHQITHFSNQGYGILAPDLLGYGNSSKPSSAEEYTCTKMAAEIVELLDHEMLDRVHVVGHDTGCMLLSRLVDGFPERLLSASFLIVPYSPPGHFALDAVNELTKQVLGFERFGYLRFFVDDVAGDIIDGHVDSFFSLFYPANPELWIENVGPTGAMEAWLRRDQQAPLAPFISEEEREIHQTIMHHHNPALNWYRALVWNLDKAEKDPNPKKLTIPVIMISPQPSPLELPVGEMMKAVAENVVLEEVSMKGHWVQLQAREEVNGILGEFWGGIGSS